MLKLFEVTMNLFKLNEKQIVNWEKTRTQNRYLYYLKWAFSVCFLFSLIMFIYNFFILNLKLEIIQFVTLSGISFAGGLIMGVINWIANEYGYKVSKNNNQ